MQEHLGQMWHRETCRQTQMSSICLTPQPMSPNMETGTSRPRTMGLNQQLAVQADPQTSAATHCRVQSVPIVQVQRRLLNQLKKNLNSENCIATIYHSLLLQHFAVRMLTAPACNAYVAFSLVCWQLLHVLCHVLNDGRFLMHYGCRPKALLQAMSMFQRHNSHCCVLQIGQAVFATWR